MAKQTPRPEQVDVVLVGAGISGIGIGRHLQVSHPDKTIAILEARTSIGGTWDLFRYPGIRSDSDLYTFGYSFKPWRDDDAIADAAKIRAYLEETVDEAKLRPLIRFQHRVVSADWSSNDALWTLSVDRTDPATGAVERIAITTQWYVNTTGYYRYDEGYSPSFEGEASFSGQIIHAQHWPEDYDHAGKRVVVIGSGATAFTLIPSLMSGPNAATHVTQLQRTPTWVVAAPRQDSVALWLTKALGADRAHPVIRWKNEALARLNTDGFKRFPGLAKRYLRRHVTKHLPSGYDVATNFTPPYNPFDQRLALVPDGDYFAAISDGRASVVTDRVRHFTATGILLESGEELHADLIVKATGLNLQLLGGTSVTVDGEPVHLPETLVYRGMMLSGVPNMVMVIGYVLSSWTLKLDFIWEQFDRLLRHADSNGYASVTPLADPTIETRPMLDFTSGYIQRSASDLPRKGTRAPWLMPATSWEDAALIKSFSVHESALRYRARREPPARRGTSTRRPTATTLL